MSNGKSCETCRRPDDGETVYCSCCRKYDHLPDWKPHKSSTEEEIDVIVACGMG